MISKANTAEFLRIANSRLKFNIFLLRKLPAAFFSGISVVKADEEETIISVPYRWFTQNPFRSTYFACLSMAAEMSTGLLAMTHLFKSVPKISMLVVSVNSNYIKKATGKTIFTCSDGLAIKDVILNAINTNQPQTFTATSIGKSEAGDILAEFKITWSFKVSTPKSK